MCSEKGYHTYWKQKLQFSSLSKIALNESSMICHFRTFTKISTIKRPMHTNQLSHHFLSTSFTKISQRKQYSDIHVVKNKHITPHKLRVISRQTSLRKKFCESRKYTTTLITTFCIVHLIGHYVEKVHLLQPERDFSYPKSCIFQRYTHLFCIPH